jgi:hypothetical protein
MYWGCWYFINIIYDDLKSQKLEKRKINLRIFANPTIITIITPVIAKSTARAIAYLLHNLETQTVFKSTSGTKEGI